MKKEVKIFFTDGGVSQNGNFGFQKSVICATDQNGQRLFLEEAGDKTCNEAELLAILRLLKIPVGKKQVKRPIIIKSDSELSVRLVNKTWFTEIDRLRNILREIWLIERNFTLEWIPREQNLAGHIIEERFGL